MEAHDAGPGGGSHAYPSPQAKGKIERPYGSMQDRIVQTCALEGIDNIDNGRAVLHEEVDRYNYYQVHSTTGETARIRFPRALKEGNNLFCPFTLPKPYSSPKDVFCLRECRLVNAYCRISLFGREIHLPGVSLHEEVKIHLLPSEARENLDVCSWWKNRVVGSATLPLEGFEYTFRSYRSPPSVFCQHPLDGFKTYELPMVSQAPPRQLKMGGGGRILWGERPSVGGRVVSSAESPYLSLTRMPGGAAAHRTLLSMLRWPLHEFPSAPLILGSVQYQGHYIGGEEYHQ